MSVKTINGRNLFITLLILQLLYMLYWGNAKGGFYVDEFFTFDNTHYISASTPKRIKLYDADFMEYNKWIDMEELKGTLTVSSENALYRDSFAYNVKIMVKSTYNWLLNYVEAVFFPGDVNKWSGISINVVLFILCQVFLYLISCKTSGSSRAALFACAMYGFSGLAVSMVVYVRFYMLANLWLLIFLYIHTRMWEEKDFRKNILYEIIAVFVLYLGYLRSPLMVIMGIGVILFFSVSLAVRKKWAQLAYYAVPIFAGGFIYAMLFTDYIKILMDPSAAVQGLGIGVAKASLIKGVLSLTPSLFITRAVKLVEIINDYLFGHLYVFVLTAVLCIYGIIIGYRQKLKRAFIYIVVLGASVFYFIASACFNLGAIRYNSFLYPFIALLVADMISDAFDRGRAGMMVTALFVIVLLGELYYTASIPRIQNLYPEEKEQVENIKNNSGINNIVIDYHFDDRVMYECLAYGDADTKVMAMYFDEVDFTDKGNELLVWQTVNQSDEILPYLEHAGYSYVEQIAVTHESKVFLCKKPGI